MWFVTFSAPVEHDQVLLHHCRQVLYDLLPVLLDPHSGCIPTRVSILTTHHSCNTWLPVVPNWGVRHFSTKEDDRLLADIGSDGGHKDRVDTTKLDIDLETQIGQGLRGGLVHILRLHALRGYAEHSVPHPLDLCIDRGLARQHHHHQLQGWEGIF